MKIKIHAQVCGSDQKAVYDLLAKEDAPERIGRLLSHAARQDTVSESEKARQAVDNAHNVLRADYWQDVRDCAESIISELKDRVKDGKRGETLREWLIEHIDESVDGHQRVIYTAKAIECLLYSDNDGVGVDEGLVDPSTFIDGIPWSQLACCAFRADVTERLDAEDIDLNEPEKGLVSEDEDSDDESEEG